jgi:phosphopantetheinyl transferase (holo-ACP synthase)
MTQHHSKLAHEASERAHKAEKPGGLFTVKQALSKALHEKAARLHHRAHAVTDEALHKEKHQEHHEILKKFNVR